jgi:sarcosine oxidase
MPHPVPAPRRPLSTVEVVVVGGGPIGAAAAWQLARRGAEVVLIERFGPRHRTGPGHDASRIYRPTSTVPAYARLADEAGGLWRELEAETGASLLHVTGGVDHGDPVRVAELAESLSSLGLPHTWLSADDAADEWPGTAFDGPMLYQPDGSGRLNADHTVAALTAAAAGHGATVRHNTRVTAIAVRGPSRAELVVDLPDGTVEVIHARRVVVAAGEWTAGLVDGLVRLPPLRAVRERSAYFPVDDGLLPCGACSVQWPTFVHHGTDGFQGLPVPGQGVKISLDGTDPDHDSGTSRSRSLEEHVSRWLPGADPTPSMRTSRAYTVSPGSNFVLERNGPLVVGTGVAPSGFTVIPALGRVIADLAADRTPEPEPAGRTARTSVRC